MKKFILGLAALLALAGCEKHFITDADFRNMVSEDFKTRKSGTLEQFMQLPEGITLQEKEALTFLYAYMPIADLTDRNADFYLENVRAAFQTRELWPEVPEREFRHFVLPIRVNNEDLDRARMEFPKELLPRIEGMSMQDAILEVNHWCHEKVTYQPSDARTASPMNLVINALGRCGEESTFLVAALRSVGIPARQVYTPRWAHTDDNHAWVEAWADGQWYFLGACEPEPVLNLGWFNAPASRAMLMHTRVFGKYDGPEEVVLEGPSYTEVNLIDNYASTSMAYFFVLDEDGKPVPDARIDFCIYNYAEFYPAVTKYTDAVGKTFLSAGNGDMLVWASKDGKFGYGRCSFGKDKEVNIVLQYENEGSSESFTLVPPPENVKTPPVSREQRKANQIRFAREDSLRHAYEATFPAGDKARGNWRTIQAFRQKEDKERVEAVLASLSTKDFHDITKENLEDYYSADDFLGSRVENEFLTPFYGYFEENLDEDFESAQEIVEWVKENVQVLNDPKSWNIPMSPEGVHKAGKASARSRDIFFVSLARAKGFEAQKDPVTGKVQYKQGDEWVDVFFDGEGPAKASPKGILKLGFTPTKTIDNPGYYSHFSISKIIDGRPRLMAFDEGEVDMGGGVDWANVFKNGFPMDEGSYMLCSGNRLSDGSVPVSIEFFTLKEGETLTVPLRIEEASGAVPVIGQIDVDKLLPLVGRGFFALAILETGKEPTNHALRDIAAAKDKLEAWGRPILLLCESQEALDRLKKEKDEGRYGVLPSTVILDVDSFGMKDVLVKAQKIEGRLPLVVLADSFGRLFFCSQGYTIGLGEQLAGTAARL